MPTECLFCEGAVQRGEALRHSQLYPAARRRSSGKSGALRHDQSHPLFNPSFRQLLHVSFKLAAKQGQRYLDLLKANADIVGKNVIEKSGPTCCWPH